MTSCPLAVRRLASCSAAVSKPLYEAGMPRVPRMATRSGRTGGPGGDDAGVEAPPAGVGPSAIQREVIGLHVGAGGPCPAELRGVAAAALGEVAAQGGVTRDAVEDVGQ